MSCSVTPDRKVSMSKDDLQSEALDIDFTACCPDADAPAEPYHAIMKVDADGKTDGTLWGQGIKLMLFDDIVAANKILEALGSPDYQLRGVTKKHLATLKQLEENGCAELFVIIGFTVRGDIEAVPLAEHQARIHKAGNPPPLRKK